MIHPRSQSTRRRYVPFPNAKQVAEPVVAATNMAAFSYATFPNYMSLVAKYSQDFYGFLADPTTSALKVYQDLLILAFIEQNIEPGSRILEVGGGVSRILLHLQNDYETWLIDEFQGVGGGPKSIPSSLTSSSIQIVEGLMGSHNEKLEDNYFDFVFSISAMEHLPASEDTIQNVIDDIDRVMKRDSHSVHCLDTTLLKKKPKFKLPVEMFMSRSRHPVNLQKIVDDPFAYTLPYNIYTQVNRAYHYENVLVTDVTTHWIS